LSVSLFDKTPIAKLVSKFKLPKVEAQTQKQAQLWDD
jgi:hypothetical protein